MPICPSYRLSSYHRISSATTETIGIVDIDYPSTVLPSIQLNMHVSFSSIIVGLTSLLALSHASPLPDPQTSGSSSSTPAANQGKPRGFNFNFNPVKKISESGLIPEELRVARYCIPFHMRYRCDSPQVCGSEFQKPPAVQRQVSPHQYQPLAPWRSPRPDGPLGLTACVTANRS